MKYAFMSFATPDATLAEMLNMAKRWNYDGIEPRISSGHAHGVELAKTADERAAILRQAQDADVEIACVATDCRFADPKTADANVDVALRCIDLAAELDSDRIRVFGGQIGDGVGREDAIALVANSLRSVADHAQARGVTVCIETHDDWCDPTHVADVLRRVGHPNVGANWDVEHPVRTNAATIDESFDRLRPWVKHLHVHDGDSETRQLVPIGTGAYDHRRVIELLLADEYDGYLSGEWIGWDEPYETHLPREVSTLRAYERELRT